VNVAFRYNPAPRVFENDSALTRFTAGLRGEINPRLRWETAYTRNRNTLEATTTNVLYLPNVNRAIAGGYDQNGNAVPGGAYSLVDATYGEAAPRFVLQPAFDPFARPAAVNPASLRYVLGDSHSAFRSTLETLDARLMGELFTLPAGPAGFALGGDFRKEFLAGFPDRNTAAGLWTGATSFQNFRREREVQAAFAEVRLPLTSPAMHIPGAHQLELSAAVRAEKFDDARVGRSTVPKYTLRWLPVDEQLAFRYTYSEAFSAPTLFSLYGPSTTGSTNQTAVRDALGSQFSGQAQQRSGSNADLRPTDSQTHSLGVVVSPRALRGLTGSVTYLHINQKDLLGTPGVVTILQSVNQLGTASPYINAVALGNFPGAPGARPITQAGELSSGLSSGAFGVSDIYVSNIDTNIAGQKIRALDATLDYESPATALGVFDLGFTASFFFDYHFQALPTQPYYEYAGTATSIQGAGTQGTLPGYRTFTTAGWRISNWEFRVAHLYIPAVQDLGTGGHAFATNPASQRFPVEAYTSWDLSASYRFQAAPGRPLSRWLAGLTLGVGVNNLTDAMPPAASRAFVDSGADTSTYGGGIGRLYSVRATKKF
jgi:iron complex outermembrane receptor protein